MIFLLAPLYLLLYQKFMRSSITASEASLNNKEIKSYVYGKRQTTLNDVTMVTLYLPLAVFSFSVKFSGFALASKVRIICALLPSVY